MPWLLNTDSCFPLATDSLGAHGGLRGVGSRMRQLDCAAVPTPAAQAGYAYPFVGQAPSSSSKVATAFLFFSKKPVYPPTPRHTLKEFYETVAGTAELSGRATLFAEKANHKLEKFIDKLDEMIEWVPHLDPNEKFKEQEVDHGHHMGGLGRDPIPPWETFHPDVGTVQKLYNLTNMARKQAEFSVWRGEEAIKHLRRSDDLIIKEPSLHKVYERGKTLITPEMLSRFEVVKMPPPLEFKYAGRGHKPGLWCRQVCRKPQDHEFAPPPWMRHTQSWNKNMMDFHIDPEPPVPAPETAEDKVEEAAVEGKLIEGKVLGKASKEGKALLAQQQKKEALTAAREQRHEELEEAEGRFLEAESEGELLSATQQRYQPRQIETPSNA